ncbi:MAG: glycine cleavage T C-terminal barrel domain-containing protein, partial [Bacteroidota bacterium]
LQRKLIGLVLSGQRSIPTFTRVKVRNEDVGWVTSVVNSIHLGKTVALAYIRSAWAVQGTLVHVALESGEVEAEVVELPFRK